MEHHPLPWPAKTGLETQFVDLFSRFGVSLDARTGSLGLSQGHLASQREGKTFAAPLLEVRLTGEHGAPLRRGPSVQQWFPWGCVQETVCGEIGLRLSVAYATADVVAVHAEVSNSGSRERTLTLEFAGRLAPGNAQPVVRFDRDATLVWLEATSRPTSAWKIREEPDFRIVAAVRPVFVPAAVKAVGESYSFKTHPFPIGGTGTESFSLFVSAAACDALADESASRDRLDQTRTLVRGRLTRHAGRDAPHIVLDAQRRWRKVEDRLPLSDVEEEYRDTARLAAAVLLKNTIRPQPEQDYGSAMGGHLGTFPARGFYEAFWIWDSAKHTLGFLEWDLQLARENILLMLDPQDASTGQLCFLQADARIASAQPPLLSWMAEEICRRDADPAAARRLLERAYPRLAKWNRWWWASCDKDGDGLAEWPDNLASGWDDSPRWDTDRPAGPGNEGGARPYAAVDLNSYLVADARHLAALAQRLGLEDESRGWSAQADALSARVLEKLYDPDDNLFYDAHGATGQFNRIKTTACFMPLWAGVPLAPDRTCDMLERYLLSELHFCGSFPFPAVAYSETRFDPAGASGYWRGPIWLDQVFFMLSVLERHRSALGLASRPCAEAARRRILDMVVRSGIQENYDARTGAPGANSREHFSWSAAAVLAIALRRYAPPG